MKKVVLYGAGKICKAAIPVITRDHCVSAIISKNKKPGDMLWDIPIISIREYLRDYRDHEIVLTVNENNAKEIHLDLAREGITEYRMYYELFDGMEDTRREQFLSCADAEQLEDVILYNALRNIEDIFYIDVGSNDPIFSSVTMVFYWLKNAHGINIDPLQELIDRTNRIRPRDINICTALGDRKGHLPLFVQQGLSTVLDKNISEEYFSETREVAVTTLSEICDQHIPKGQQITFLKIDVEGFERNVLLGTDLKRYRPMVIVMEATLPGTMIPNHDEWEDILLENRYHHVYSYGVNRYYVADEHPELDKCFEPMWKIMGKYDVYSFRPIHTF